MHLRLLLNCDSSVLSSVVSWYCYIRSATSRMMVRVHERHGLPVPSAAVLHKRAAPKRKASYKVIFEEIGGKQKKLKTLVRFPP